MLLINALSASHASCRKGIFDSVLSLAFDEAASGWKRGVFYARRKRCLAGYVENDPA